MTTAIMVVAQAPQAEAEDTAAAAVAEVVVVAETQDRKM